MQTLLLILVFNFKVSLCLNYSCVIQSSIKDSNITNNRLSAALAIDRDISTFTQTKRAINNYWKINFTSTINISCFTIISSEGKFQITISSRNVKNSKQICQEFLVIDAQDENVVRCCQKPLEGDAFVITRTDMGILRLYEVIIRTCSDNFSCDRCSHCATCDAANGMCLTCPPFKYGKDCGLHCPNNCSRCDKNMGTCKACSRCAGDCNIETETCSQCNPGFFQSPYCYACNNSMRHCFLCSSSEKCDQCVAGYHGPKCKDKNRDIFVTFNTHHVNFSTSNLTFTTESVMTTRHREDKSGITENDILHEGMSKDSAKYFMGLKYKSVNQSSVDNEDMINDVSSAIRAIDNNSMTYTQTKKAVNSFWRISFTNPVNITCFTIISNQGEFKIKIASSDASVERFCDEFSVKGDKESVSRCCQNQTEGTSFVVYRSDSGKLRLYEVSLINCFAVIPDILCKKCTCARCTTRDSTSRICSSNFTSKCIQTCDNLCAKNCSESDAENDVEMSRTTEAEKFINMYESTRNGDDQIKIPNDSDRNDGSSTTDLTAVIFGVVVLCLLGFFFAIKRLDITDTSKCISYNQAEVIGAIEEQTHVFSVSQNIIGDEANSIFLEEIAYVNVFIDEKQRDVEYSNTTSHRLSLDTFFNNHRIRRENSTFEEDEFANLPTGLLDLCTEALKKENICKNRYRYVYPYDFCRVVLDTCGISGRNDYINACYIEDNQGKRSYIAAQGPFTSLTLVDFWRMVWQENCTRIVMLTNLFEGDKMKCLKYWPDDVVEICNFRIQLESEDINEMYTIRYFIVQQKDERRKVIQFHFTGWPDCEVPSNVNALLCFRNLVKKGRPNSDGPIIVHCSAGIGRTGTFIALDYLLEEGSTMESVDIINCVSKLRQQRAHSVQTKEQYIFLYDALAQGLSNIRRRMSLCQLADEI